jgi:hypothetical protein
MEQKEGKDEPWTEKKRRTVENLTPKAIRLQTVWTIDAPNTMPET